MQFDYFNQVAWPDETDQGRSKGRSLTRRSVQLLQISRLACKKGRPNAKIFHSSKALPAEFSLFFIFFLHFSPNFIISIQANSRIASRQIASSCKKLLFGEFVFRKQMATRMEAINWR